MWDRRLQMGVVLGLLAVLAVPGLPTRCCCAKTAASRSSARLPACCAARLAKKLPAKPTVTHQCQCRVKVTNPTTLPPKSPTIVATHAAAVLSELRPSAEIAFFAAASDASEFRPIAAVSRSQLCCWLV